MSQIIEVNFKTGQKIQKYVFERFVCVGCLKDVIFDSRLEKNIPYIRFDKSRGVLCQQCCIDVKGVSEDEGW